MRLDLLLGSAKGRLGSMCISLCGWKGVVLSLSLDIGVHDSVLLVMVCSIIIAIVFQLPALEKSLVCVGGIRQPASPTTS